MFCDKIQYFCVKGGCGFKSKREVERTLDDLFK